MATIYEIAQAAGVNPQTVQMWNQSGQLGSILQGMGLPANMMPDSGPMISPGSNPLSGSGDMIFNGSQWVTPSAANYQPPGTFQNSEFGNGYQNTPPAQNTPPGNTGLTQQQIQDSYYQNAYPLMPSSQAPPISGQWWNQSQPPNTQQFIGSIGSDGVNSSTAQEILAARNASLAAAASQQSGPPPGSTQIGNTGWYVTPSGATWSRPGTPGFTPAQYQAALSAPNSPLAAHFNQNTLPAGYANPQTEANYLKTSGLNPANSTYLTSQTPTNNYFANLSGGNNANITGPGTTLPSAGNNFSQGPPIGGGTQLSPGGSQPPPGGSNIPPGRIGQLIQLGIDPETAKQIDGLYGPAMSAQQVFAAYTDWNGSNSTPPGGGGSFLEALRNQATRPGENPFGFDWAWSDWDGPTGKNSSQWGLNLSQTPESVQGLLDLLTGINNLGYGQNLPVSFGGLSGLINQPNDSGQYSTNWNNEQNDLYSMLLGLSGGPQGGYQDYNSQVDSLFTNNPLLGAQFRGRSATDFLNDPGMLSQYYQAMDSIRAQFGLPSRAEVLAGGTTQTPLGIGAYAGTPANNAPFSPTISPLEGLGWQWFDPDGQGALPYRWAQTLMPGTNLTQSNAQALLGRINQSGLNPNLFNLPTGNNNPFTRNGNQYGLNTSYFAPAPPPGSGSGGGGNPFSSIIDWFSSSATGGSGGQPQQPTGGYQPVWNSTPQSAPAPAPFTNRFNPGRTGAQPNFSSFNYWGYGSGNGTGNRNS